MQRFGHFAELRENQEFFLPRRDGLHQFGQTQKFSGIFRRKITIAQILRRMVANLFEAHQIRQNNAAPFDALDGFVQRLLHLFDTSRVKRGLRTGKIAINFQFRFVRQVGNNASVGLEPTQNEGLRQLAQRGVVVVEFFGEIQKRFQVAQQSGIHEIEDAP
ncbi:hypothetical protein SDC9_188343 [bioreactor metagenome]|uniref:Uncharacterized protein n=1 Tax=bioreactor metagenome TaxID=1076179 RepID=A0A645HX80_9ZZZZ